MYNFDPTVCDDQEQRIQLLRSCTNHPSSTYRVHASTHLKVVYKNKTQSTSQTISITCKQHTQKNKTCTKVITVKDQYLLLRKR